MSGVDVEEMDELLRLLVVLAGAVIVAALSSALFSLSRCALARSRTSAV